MADVHERLTGESGVCLSALWPGANNLLTGVVNAYLDHAPLVATPNRPLSVGATKNHPPCDFGGLHPYPLSLKRHRVQTAPRSARKRHWWQSLAPHREQSARPADGTAFARESPMFVLRLPNRTWSTRGLLPPHPPVHL